MAARASRAGIHPRHSSRPLHHRGWRMVASAAAAVIGFVGALGGTYTFLVTRAWDTHDVDVLLADPDSTIEPDNTPTDFAAGQAVNIAIIGTDERNDENADIGGYVGGMRGDVTMVMHISADRSRVDVVSIPRDSRVRISDCTMYDGTVHPGWTAKFNEALWSGGRNGDRGEGAACVMRTITDLTGVEFNGHFVMVDFTGFANVVDALGGVPMCIEQDIRSPLANLELEAGPQVLDGATALGFARARTGTGLGGDGSDLSRIDRQQELLTNTFRTALGMNMLTDTPALTSFLRAGAESLTMDNELGDINSMIGLAYSLRNFDTANLTFTTVPWRYAGDGSGDVLWEEEEAAEMWARMVADEPILDPEPETTPTPEPTGDGTPTPAPTPTSPSATSPEPAVSPEPLRESVNDILANC